jgi:hypothetical protein
MSIALWIAGGVGAVLLLAWRLRAASAKVQAILDELPAAAAVVDHHYDEVSEVREAVPAAWPHPPRRLWPVDRPV